MTENKNGTPLVMLPRFGAEACGMLAAKLEWTHPTGSGKERPARAMLDAACSSGRLRPGGTVIAATSGNMGVSLAALGAARGVRVILTMPEGMSRERVQLLRAYGAELHLSPAHLGMAGSVALAESLRCTVPGSVLLDQFSDPANPLAHRLTTGPELWQATQGQIACLVAGAGTGGTVTGAGWYLKGQNPNVRIVAVEPAASPVLSGGASGAHGIQGIGAGFVPLVYDAAAVDEVIPVTEAEAVAAVRRLARTEGLLAGISSGAALHAAYAVAQRAEFAGKLVAALLMDGGERYLSTGLFDDATEKEER